MRDRRRWHPTPREEALPHATWAARKEILDKYSVAGGIVLGELTDPTRESPDFAPGRPKTWGNQGQGQLITMSPTDGNGHVLVTSQASGYKSTGLVIPNILTYKKGPILVFDPKCELYARTREARRAMGFEPVVIDADNGFDPARLIAALAVKHPAAYYEMAKLMIPKGYSGIENAAYFKAAATKLFTALLGYYGEKGSTNMLQNIAEVLALPPDKVFSQVQKRIEDTKLPFVRNQLNALQGMDSKFWHSIKTEITNQLLFGEMPDVQRYITMKPESKLPSQVIDPNCDIFLNIPQHVAENFPAMLRLMLGSMLTAAQLIEINEAPRARRLFLIDEAAKLGAMDILENIRDRGRSLGLHLMLFYQTPGEIARLWGQAGMTSWRDGCSATIMGPVSSRTSAQGPVRDAGDADCPGEDREHVLVEPGHEADGGVRQQLGAGTAARRAADDGDGDQPAADARVDHHRNRPQADPSEQGDLFRAGGHAGEGAEHGANHGRARG